MKVIISHDIDHMTVWEHYKDLIIPKHIIRNHIELIKGAISFREYKLRWFSLFHNKWQHIDEIMQFNKKQGIRSNFFIGVNNGVGLSYSLKQVKKWVPRIIENGFEVGVHGIDYESYEKVKKEFETFSIISKLTNFGIRMHYLRQNDHTFTFMERSGYVFDASEIGYKNPYKIGKMWEFPLQMMEIWFFHKEKSYQNVELEEAKKAAIKAVEKAKEANLSYLNILFHDRYYHDSFVTWKQWYDWLVTYLKDEGFEFITYQDAVNELNNKRQ